MIANTVKDGPLEITGGEVTIPPKKFLQGKLVKKKILRVVIRKNKIVAEEATCILACKSME